MPVLATKTEPKCKLCRHPRRQELDAILEKRSQGEKDENGRRYNLEYVLELFAEMGVANPTEDNVKNHLRKHCQLVNADVAAAEARVEQEMVDERLRVFEAVMGEGWQQRRITPEELIDVRRRLYAIELHKRVANGLDTGITHDHAQKDVAEETKRKHEEGVNDLMRSLGRGIEGAFRQLEPVRKPQGELIEGEAVEDDG